ncbi:Serine/threonine-protein kinase [Yamadazyma tenuis]|uniref:Serine/threonine-protein kinase SCH9 n=1 Tax=Candida tenuis (strain ATCC 10573 / BCRC 21748 / CBS 615 / JCM 9827 / NBRC 10315 / NRRL Y-1498 / VKM Y-70) TaxID=590646 RepID=G3B9K4_CANTC|nr:Pkinase-domain-containing protein [Yamadazyma tenuis ATCC 10573]EGV61913.1 Pkinase-domain-containing protein [Yamadazyma tenuis ATCC 10573]WEJ93147.1 Serine/threonine-protein kinase [Yamadazyma tenuis]
MTDFAKSIFGFSSLKREISNNSNNEPSQGQPEDQSQLQSDSSSQDNKLAFSKIYPKSLNNVTPTTAENSSMVYGTTSLKKPDSHQTSNFNQFQSMHQIQENYQNIHQQYQVDAGDDAGLKSDASQSIEHPPSQTSFQSSGDLGKSRSDFNTHPIIITTDETGQMNQTESQSHPKGKLKVTILEASNLLIHSNNSQPYVVCTFESSEFITNAPDSFNNRSATTAGRNNGSNRPMYQSQSSSNHLTISDYRAGISNPVWNHEAIFDVVGNKSELEISIYDSSTDDSFLGHVRIHPFLYDQKRNNGSWFNLAPRVAGERVSGSIKIKWEYSNLLNHSYGPEDFEILRLLGKGTFGKVYQVKKRDNNRIYAMKVLSKKVIVKKKEIAHTIGERNILVRTSAAQSPFIVGLKFSFQTPTDLYLVTDYMSGGELFWHLQKEGRFPEDRAKFYIAELVLALEHLHDNDIVYRDLKPENILLDANGHIVLCDFGLSKANLNNDGTTNTFCGTTEYLAPEVLLDESGYTKMVDFWSLGVLIFEMCCGWSPFYAENTQQMYKNIAFGKVRFPKEILSSEGRLFVKRLLNRNPKHRLGSLNDARELKAHPFFHDIDWELLKNKTIPPPFKPHLTSELDTSNFDPEFTNESTSVLKKQMEMASTPLSPGIQANFKGFTYVDASAMDDHFSKSHRYNSFRAPGSFIPGNPNLPPDEDVIDDQIDEEDEMDVDMEDEEFINGRFDL